MEQTESRRRRISNRPSFLANTCSVALPVGMGLITEIPHCLVWVIAKLTCVGHLDGAGRLAIPSN
jgi:hypothetical protein